MVLYFFIAICVISCRFKDRYPSTNVIDSFEHGQRWISFRINKPKSKMYRLK